jgi:hypothetical protein
MTKPLITILSLGAGVQSTTMALMYAHGDLAPMPDAAIFADTGWEPAKVYRHLEWLMSDNVLPFPVHVVSKGNLRADVVGQGTGRTSKYSRVPWFVTGRDGRAAMGRRQCTKEYKLYPIRDTSKALYYEKTGAEPRKRIPPGSIGCLIGISTDEAARMKPASVQYIENRWPLIDAGMSRRDCLRWMESHEYPAPPKSSCVGCPYHSDNQWREIRDNMPEAWEDAVAVDKIIRSGGQRTGIKSNQFMHRSLVPLDEVDLRTHDEKGQPDLFNEECEGMCGL